MAEEAMEMSGIDRILREREPALLNRFYELDDASLGKWVGMEVLELWQAVFLHSNVDPDPLGRESVDALTYLDDFNGGQPKQPASEFAAPERRLHWNLVTAVEAVRNGVLRLDSAPTGDLAISIVRVADFQYWAARSCLPVIGPWLQRSAASVEEGVDEGRLLAVHRTKLLDVMEEVLKRYWRTQEQGGHYVPGDIRTATSQTAIAEWIREAHPWVSKVIAEAIAAILRPDDLPKGRHPSK